MLDTATSEERTFETLDDIAARMWMTAEDLHEIMQAFTEPDGLCLKWTGQTDSRGYGAMKRRQGEHCERIGAHRLAYAMHVAPLPSGLVVLHLCDNKLCVNPHHLALGTQKANMFDFRMKGHAAHGCKHPFSKLNAEQVNEIRVLAKYGWQHKQLAEQFGVSRPTITKVVNRTGYERVA